MKHGKKPTREQKMFLAKLKLNPADWLIVKDTPELMQIVHRYSERTTKIIHKAV